MNTAVRRRKTVLLITPTFVPDPAAVGQHMADLAVALAGRGHRVVVYTANRGYDNPADRYAPREDYHGAEVRRLPFSSFGKSSLLTRALGPLVFMIQCIFVVLTTRNLAGVVVTTSPPFGDLAGAIATRLRPGVPLVYWAMDLYAEQVVAVGKVAPSHPLRHLLRWIQWFILRRSTAVIALDRFMAEIVKQRGAGADRVTVLPPWSHVEALPWHSPETSGFRAKHGLCGDFVVMYSGNHTPTNPLTTVLQAAVRLKDVPRLRFVFVGGGAGKREVEQTIAEHGLTRALSLPYQPLDELQHSLSAADLHVATLGQNLVGIVHPCKIYGAMAVARPVLFVGPEPSHIGDLLEAHDFGWHVEHGDVDGAVGAIRKAMALSADEVKKMGLRGQAAVRAELSQEQLCGRLCDILERAMRLPAGGAAGDDESSQKPISIGAC